MSKTDGNKSMIFLDFLEEQGVYTFPEDKSFYHDDPFMLWTAIEAHFFENVSTKELLLQLSYRALVWIKSTYLKTKDFILQLKTRLHRFTPNKVWGRISKL